MSRVEYLVCDGCGGRVDRTEVHLNYNKQHFEFCKFDCLKRFVLNGGKRVEEKTKIGHPLFGGVRR